MWNGTTPVAVKTLKPGSISTEDFLQEIEVMKRLRHPGIIRLYGVCTKEPTYIVLELAKFGCLLEYLRGDGQSLKLPQLITMSGHVAAGMAYLESQNFVHCDLAARNVLVTDKLVCKVTDFFVAASMEEYINGELYFEPDIKIPIKWSAPEVLASHDNFSVKSDVWSFGILLSEVITYGRMPYFGMRNLQVIEALQDGYRMPQPEGCPDKLYSIMRDCWKEDPDTRPTFESLKWQLEEFFTAEDLGYTEVRCQDWGLRPQACEKH